MTATRRAIVVGASGGIGPEIARRLHDQGYALVLVDRDVDAVAAALDFLPVPSLRALDLSDRAALGQLCQDIEQDTQAYDVAVFNAGIVFPNMLVDADPAQLDMELEVNLRAAIHLLRAFARHMQPRRRGHIIATVSMGGIIALKGSASYAASKFGLRGFLMSLHNELRSHDVHVSGIYPSGVDTPMLRFEARNNGSPLNFVSTPQTVQQIGQAFDKALRSRKLEIYPSWGDSLSGRLVGSFPWLIPLILPLMERLGERGRQRYLATLERPR